MAALATAVVAVASVAGLHLWDPGIGLVGGFALGGGGVALAGGGTVVSGRLGGLFGDGPEPALREQGFEPLADEADEGGAVDPEHCWQRPFTVAEAAEGIPIERYGDTPHKSVTEAVLDDLEDGGGAVLLGEPGTGKTTTARAVAAEWHRRGGTVVRHRPGNRAVTDPDELAAALRAAAEPGLLDRVVDAVREREAAGTVLVVVEDATRQEVVRFYETLAEIDADEDVSVLATARDREWATLDDRARQQPGFDPDAGADGSVLAELPALLEPHWLPSPEEEAVDRLLARFEEQTGTAVAKSAESLLEEVRTETAAGTFLLLSSHLPVGETVAGSDGDGEEPSDEDESALEASVEAAYRAVADPDAGDWPDEVAQRPDALSDAALLVNVLNAAGLPVAPAYVHALAEADGGPDHDWLDRALAAFEGVFVTGEGSGHYLARHPRWSALYLEEHLAAGEDGAAREQFERVVDALFRLFDDDERRAGVREALSTGSGRLDSIEAAPGDLAAATVQAIFRLCERRPPLVALFGTSDASELRLPDSVDAAVRATCAYSRYRGFDQLGRLDDAAAELERFRDLAGDDPGVEAVYYAARGTLAHERDEYVAARAAHQQSLAYSAASNDRRGVADRLGDLGSVALQQDDYDDAREYHERRLEVAGELGDRRRQAESLADLGAVAREQDDYSDARDYYRRSLEIARALGDRRVLARVVGSIGSTARHQGQYEEAREYHEESLELARELGDRELAGTQLGNLGLVARRLRNFERAREYLDRSLAIARALDDRQREATTLGNLGSVALQQDDYDDAREYYRQSLELAREIGDRQGVANHLEGLGTVASNRGDYEDAREYYAEAIEAFADVGAVERELGIARNLVVAALDALDEETAAEWSERGRRRAAERDHSAPRDFESEFDRIESALDAPTGDVRQRYRDALRHVLDSDPRPAQAGFLAAWNSRADLDEGSEAFEHAVAAGVGLAAHLDVVGDGDPEDVAAIREEVAAHVDDLSEPVATVADALGEGEVDIDPSSLLEDIDRSELERDPEQADTEVLEAVTFATLLNELV